MRVVRYYFADNSRALFGNDAKSAAFGIITLYSYFSNLIMTSESSLSCSAEMVISR